MIVTTILDTPYVMMRESVDANLTGNDRFEGYIVDLLEEIADIVSCYNPRLAFNMRLQRRNFFYIFIID